MLFITVRTECSRTFFPRNNDHIGVDANDDTDKDTDKHIDIDTDVDVDTDISIPISIPMSNITHIISMPAPVPIAIVIPTSKMIMNSIPIII